MKLCLLSVTYLGLFICRLTERSHKKDPIAVNYKNIKYNPAVKGLEKLLRKTLDEHNVQGGDEW